eukprot:Skav230252  [mRNA]  locus=scaffold1520:80974:82563:+ [translate_table: standard]
MSRLVAPGLSIPSLRGPGAGPGAGPVAGLAGPRSSNASPPRPAASYTSEATSDTSAELAGYSDFKQPRTSHLHLAVPEESDVVRLAPRESLRGFVPESLRESPRESLRESSQAEALTRPRGSGLGGALSTFGAPAEWWHDSIILGRLSALALRYFASKATQKPWRAWLQHVQRAREKQNFYLRSQKFLAFRRWYRHH